MGQTHLIRYKSSFYDTVVRSSWCDFIPNSPMNLHVYSWEFMWVGPEKATTPHMHQLLIEFLFPNLSLAGEQNIWLSLFSDWYLDLKNSLWLVFITWPQAKYFSIQPSHIGNKCKHLAKWCLRPSHIYVKAFETNTFTGQINNTSQWEIFTFFSGLSGFPPSTKHSKFQFDLETVDEEPLTGMCPCQFQFIYYA